MIDLLGGLSVLSVASTIPALLQFDHIHGDGKKDITNNRHGYVTSVLKSVMANEDKFQLLCANCNWIKRAENHEVRGPARNSPSV